MEVEIMKSRNIVLNFLYQHENYHSVDNYICKSDTRVCHSKHPNLKDVGSPVTKKSTQALHAGRKKNLSTKLMNLVMAPQSHHVVKLNVFLIWMLLTVLITNNIQRL